MPNPHLLHQLQKEDPRYKLEAYQFVRDALQYAHDTLQLATSSESEEEDGKRPGGDRHLTGQQLCEAIRLFAIDQYGLLAKTVLNNWGVHTTNDFGEIVYNLIKIGLMRRSRNDRREDFDNCYDFEEAFVTNFQIEAP